MTITVGGIIKNSLYDINVLASGGALPPDEGNDGLEILRQMVSGWALETLLIPVVNVVTKQFVDGESVYTIGIYPDPTPPDTHIETPRPEKILTSFIRDNQGTDYYLESMDNQTFAEISRKTNVARPSRYYVREGWPLNTISLESIPYANETLHLEVVQPLEALLPMIGLTEEINLPPGYERALRLSLNFELAPRYGKELSQLLATQAVTSKKLIKRSNYRDLVSGMDRAISSRHKGFGTYIINQGP